MRFVTTVLAVTLLLTSLACRGPESANGKKLVITGSSTIAPLISDIAKRFEAEHPEIRVDVQTGGSSRGLADVRQGLADLGMVSRSPKDGENDIEWFPLAKDGLAIIVHRNNPLDSLTLDQVRSIYRGEVTSWSEISELGAETGPITVVNKAEGRSTLEVFLEHVGLESREIQASVVIGDNQQGLKTVAGNPGAIGYVSIGAAELEAGRDVPIKLIKLGENVPSTQNVRDGSYPIARTLHLVATAPDRREHDKTETATRFLEYCRSSAVHDLVEGQYFVPLAG